MPYPNICPTLWPRLSNTLWHWQPDNMVSQKKSIESPASMANSWNGHLVYSQKMPNWGLWVSKHNYIENKLKHCLEETFLDILNSQKNNHLKYNLIGFINFDILIFLCCKHKKDLLSTCCCLVNKPINVCFVC